MPMLLLTLFVRAQHIVTHPTSHSVTHPALHITTNSGRRLSGERGQATTEYALVLLAAALVALLVVAWATAGGGAAKISQLFNKVIDAVIDKV